MRSHACRTPTFGTCLAVTAWVNESRSGPEGQRHDGATRVRGRAPSAEPRAKPEDAAPGEIGAADAHSQKRTEWLFAAIEWIAERIQVEVIGIERLPRGRALLVANHAFGWDIVFAMAVIRQKTGRPVWALGEHVWWRVPLVRRIAADLGTVDGTPDNAVALV